MQERGAFRTSCECRRRATQSFAATEEVTHKIAALLLPKGDSNWLKRRIGCAGSTDGNEVAIQLSKMSVFRQGIRRERLRHVRPCSDDDLR
jgi:hypothetical protein